MPTWSPSRGDFVSSRFWTKDFLDRCVRKWLDLPSPEQPSVFDYYRCFTDVFGDEALRSNEAIVFHVYAYQFGCVFLSLMRRLCDDQLSYIQDSERALLLTTETSQERIMMYETLVERLKWDYDSILVDALKSRQWTEAEMYIERKQGLAPPDDSYSPLHIALKNGAPKHVVERLLEYFHVRYGEESCEPISCFFAPVDPEIYCDLSTLQLMLDRGALVARNNLRVSIKSLFAAFRGGRKEHVLLAFNHNYTRESDHLIVLPRDYDGTHWSFLLNDDASPQEKLSFLLLLVKFGARPYNPSRIEGGLRNFFRYVEHLRTHKLDVHESIVAGVKLACVLQVLCCGRLPRFKDSTPISVLTSDNIRLLKLCLDVTFDDEADDEVDDEPGDE